MSINLPSVSYVLPKKSIELIHVINDKKEPLICNSIKIRDLKKYESHLKNETTQFKREKIKFQVQKYHSIVRPALNFSEPPLLIEKFKNNLENNINDV